MAHRSLWVGALAFVSGGAALADPPAQPTPTVIKVQPGKAQLNGDEVLPKSMAQAREVLAQTRDYAGFLVRQERVNNVLLPEQTCEIRARMVPKCINVRIVKPDALRGEETSYMPEKVRTSVRFKPAGVEGVRGFQTQPLDAAKVLAHTRHPMSEVGLTAMLDRIDAILAAERGMGHPVAIVASDYVFADKRVTKCELFADIAHPRRYAAKVTIYFDVESKLPMRFEAHDAEGQLIEAQSYVGIKRNTGLGDPAFVR